MKKGTKILRIVSGVLIAIIGLILCLPFSRLYIGKCLKVEMSVKVDGEYVIPENITCIYGIGEPQKIRVVNKANEVVVYIEAFRYGMNTISYDVNTPEGVKHFTYSIFKTHQWGPRVDFWYRNDVQHNEENEWYANVWLDKENVEARATTIWLAEDENAHVQYGP